jgi:hypothetical protein
MGAKKVQTECRLRGWAPVRGAAASSAAECRFRHLRDEAAMAAGVFRCADVPQVTGADHSRCAFSHTVLNYLNYFASGMRRLFTAM